MGMFDYVKFEGKCGNCGKLIKGFQSKDAGCMLEQIEPSEVRNFYTTCEHCEFWNEYNKIDYYKDRPGFWNLTIKKLVEKFNEDFTIQISQD